MYSKKLDVRMYERSLPSHTATKILLVSNISVFLVLNVYLGYYGVIDERVLEAFGQVNSYILQGSHLYQIFTSMFVHMDPIHLLMNMFALWYFGRYVEGYYRSTPFLITYIVSGIAGNAFTLLLGPSLTSAGASGSIFGILGAYTASFRGDPRAYATALTYAVLILLISLGPRVNPIAHLVGFLGGLALGFLFLSLNRVED